MSDVLVVAEHRRGAIRDVTFELVTAGRALADATDGELHVAVIGGDTEQFADTVNLEGVDEIHLVPFGEEFNHDVYSQAISTLVDDLEISYPMLPHSVNGLDYAPAVANELSLPVMTDITEFAYDDEITVVRDMYGSKVESTHSVDADRAMLTLRGGEWPPATQSGDAEISVVEDAIEEGSIGSEVTGFEDVGAGDVDITEADVLVSIGRGIEEEDNLPLVREFARTIDGTLSASRPIVDSGWLPKNLQVGQSGKVVTPQVYIAIGISGAVQHVAGMKGSETIIAINTDPNAPIFDIADYGIEGDLFDVVPELIEEFGGDPPDV